MRIPVILAIWVFVLAFIADAYIWWDIRTYRFFLHRHRGRPRLWSWIYAGTAVLCWALLIVAISLPRRDSESSIMPVMWMLYTFISIYIPKLIYVVFSLLGRIARLWGGRRYYTGLVFGLPIGISVFIMMWWGVMVTRNELQVNELAVTSPGIPEGFNGYRIVQFSDAHVGTWGKDTTFIAEMTDTINALNPDLIVFTGDIVNRNTKELLPFVDVLKRLKAKDGVYSILGNHDYGMYQDWDSEEEKSQNMVLMYELQKKMGWKLLRNQYAYITHNGDTLKLIGVENWGEPPFNGLGDLDEAQKTPYQGAETDTATWNGYSILLTHNPEHWNRVVTKESDVDLSLAGHSHAMQIMVKAGDWKWSPAQWRYPQWGGFYDRRSGVSDKDLLLYVNIGVGEVGMPFRILQARPEITVFTLQHE